jgi:hypothetical protein
MEHDPHDATEAEEVFDRALTDVLEKHGHALEEQSRVLVATGTASIPMPGVILRARLRPPHWWRHGVLEIAREDPVTGRISGTSAITLGKSDWDRASLIRNITIHLALMLA